MNDQATLITGAGSGIGLALAEEFARHGHPLFLTSRDESELRRISAQLSQRYNVSVDYFAQDLEQPNACQTIYSAFQSRGRTLDILCNNAGLGYHGKFWEIPLERQLQIIKVNIEAPVALLHLFLPEMLRRSQGRILNVASVAGFEPGPLLAVYHASKAFFLSLTEALAVETKDSGVTVSALCPGPTDTDFFEKADAVDIKGFQKTHVMSPQEVAEVGYKGLMNGDPTIVPGASNKALVFARRFLSEGAQAKMNEKVYEKMDPSERKREPGDVRRAEKEPTITGAS